MSADGYRVTGTFVAIVPYAASAKDAEEIVRDGMTIEGSVHGQYLADLDIDTVTDNT